ncbi:MAG TPA: tetratricopeptide repeat protein [bacterium]|nr:tetratricopeptide repeat protein [bacterium]HPS30794.1 tetratricopeptide repeat protein [bacterium]
MKGDFSKNTIEVLRKRAGEMCTKCKIITSKPNSNDTDFVNLGEAAHIRGRRQGENNRFDPKMTDDQKSNINNAIWLCRRCHKEIDSDEIKYSVEKLISLKKEHENNIEKSNYNKLSYPYIKTLEEKIYILEKEVSEKSEEIDIAYFYKKREEISTLKKDKEMLLETSNKFISAIFCFYEEFMGSKSISSTIKNYEKVPKEVEEIDENLFYEDKVAFSKLLLLKAILFEINRDYERSIEYYDKAFELNKSFVFSRPYVKLLGRRGIYEKAIKVCSEAISLENGTDVRLFYLRHISHFYMKSGKMHSALDYCELALKEIDDLAEESDLYKLQKAQILNGAGQCLTKLKIWERARSILEDSLNIYWKMMFKKEIDIEDDLLGLFNSIGNLYMSRGALYLAERNMKMTNYCFSEAETYFVKAFNFIFSDDVLAKSKIRLKIIITLNLCRIVIMKNDKEKTLECLDKVSELLQKAGIDDFYEYFDFNIGSRLHYGYYYKMIGDKESLDLNIKIIKKMMDAAKSLNNKHINNILENYQEGINLLVK